MIWLGVLADSFKRTRTFQIELEFANDGFRGEGNTGVPGAGGGGGGEMATNVTHLWRGRQGLSPARTVGRRVLSPLRDLSSPKTRAVILKQKLAVCFYI